jgi:hypothetical protein
MDIIRDLVEPFAKIAQLAPDPKIGFRKNLVDPSQVSILLKRQILTCKSAPIELQLDETWRPAFRSRPLNDQFVADDLLQVLFHAMLQRH